MKEYLVEEWITLKGENPSELIDVYKSIVQYLEESELGYSMRYSEVPKASKEAGETTYTILPTIDAAYLAPTSVPNKTVFKWLEDLTSPELQIEYKRKITEYYEEHWPEKAKGLYSSTHILQRKEF